MKLTAKTRNELPTSDFTDPDDRKFPLPEWESTVYVGYDPATDKIVCVDSSNFNQIEKVESMGNLNNE